MKDFMKPIRSGRVPGEVLDFHILVPIAEQEKEGKWKLSKHKKLVDFMLKQLEPVGNDR